MADYNFTVTAGQTIARELLLACLNVGTQEAPEWKVVGKRVEDSSAEYDWGEETVKDIRQRFGHFSIQRASLIGYREFGSINPRDDHVIHPVGWRSDPLGKG